MKFTKLKLFTQLWIVGLLITSVFLMVIGISYFKLVDIKLTSERISKVRTPTYNASEELQSGVNNVLANLRGYMLLGDDNFKTERLETWKNMRSAQQKLNELSQNWTEPSNKELLIIINSLLNDFKTAQDDIEKLAWLYENLPATQLLVSTAIPLADNIYNKTTLLIDFAKARAKTSEHLWDKTLITLADFRGTFAISLAHIRAFILSADPKFVEAINVKWSKNSDLFQQIKDIESTSVFLNDEQRTALSQLIQDREEFSSLPNKLIELRKRDDWNRANHQLKYIAAPQGKKLLQALGAMSSSQERLLFIDVNSSEREISTLTQIILWLILVPILLSVGVFVYVKTNIIAPLSQTINLMTKFSEDISHGYFQIRKVHSTSHETFQLASALQLIGRKTEKIISELKANQKQLIEQKYAMDQHSIIATTDLGGTITYANDKFVDISGYPIEELIGQNHRILNSGKQPESYWEDMYRKVASGKVWNDEVCNRAKDGHLYWVDTTIVPFMDDKGKPISYISIRSDITARKKATGHLIEAREEAIAANLAKSEFLSQMSHELRTPMNAILGFGQVLEMDPKIKDPSQLQNIQEILNAGYHLLELINEVLDLAKIEAGTIEIYLEDIPIYDVLEKCVNMMSTIADDRQIVITNMPKNDYRISADPVRIKQIFLNLLSNAIKYNRDQGQVILESKILSNKRLQISITDTGIGLPTEDLSKIFAPFMRLSNKANTEGVGIGLAITKHLVEQMGGNISVKSTIGKGSTFIIELVMAN